MLYQLHRCRRPWAKCSYPHIASTNEDHSYMNLSRFMCGLILGYILVKLLLYCTSPYSYSIFSLYWINGHSQLLFCALFILNKRSKKDLSCIEFLSIIHLYLISIEPVRCVYMYIVVLNCELKLPIRFVEHNKYCCMGSNVIIQPLTSYALFMVEYHFLHKQTAHIL